MVRPSRTFADPGPAYHAPQDAVGRTGSDEVLLAVDHVDDALARNVWDEAKLPGRCLFVPNGPHGDWGMAARNFAMRSAQGTHLAFLDDDDVYRPGALEVMRAAAAVNTGRPLLFRLRRSGEIIGQSPRFACGNVSTQAIVVPNVSGKLGTWGNHYAGDFDFAETTVRHYPEGPVWVPATVADWRPNGYDVNGVRGWLTQAEGDKLARLAEGKKVLEIGSYCGRSTIAMAWGASELHVVDPFNHESADTFAEFSENIRRYGVEDRIVIHRGRIEDALAKLPSDFDLAFIDGDHHLDSVRRDASNAARVLKPSLDSRVAFHDHNNPDYPGVTQAVGEFLRLGYSLVSVTDMLAEVTRRPSVAIRRPWAEDALLIDHSEDRLYGSCPSLGLVIGTFAGVAYVHLQLESRKRHFPTLPTLVHDDGSHRASQLKRLCDAYGAEFECNEQRLPHCLGDISVYYGGLKWAQQHGIEILVKVSRRWVFLTDWGPDLRKLARESQYHTFSNHTKTFGFGFRTECIGMSVKRWTNSDFLRNCIDLIGERRAVFVEGHLHQFARRLDASNCAAADSWRHAHPAPPERNGYAQWELIGDDRVCKSDLRLWHDANSPAEYAAVAKQWGLSYEAADFADPNEGAGIGEPPP